MYINEYFILDEEYVEGLQALKPDFGYNGFGEFLFYRTYSRMKAGGRNENWADCVNRVINGIFSIRKDWYLKNRIPWDEAAWQSYAYEMALSMFQMEWLPPGRGLWAMGTPFIYERGSMALYNCAFTYFTSTDLADDASWFMDCLMLGVGVGFQATTDPMKVYNPVGSFKYIIPDTREGWVNSVKLLILAYTTPYNRVPEFLYEQIRPEGQPIRGFGGIASGPEPLMKLHDQIKSCFKRYMSDANLTRLKADIGNIIGCCVVAGNVRRSAELLLGEVTDQTFLDLKDYDKNPDRQAYGWMSNNSALFYDDAHYEMLGEIARRVIRRGEPGVANIRNFPYGRIGKNDIIREDRARGLNPCGEITLEHRETCNVVETLPTRCYLPGTEILSVQRWYKACEYATTYAASVSLLPTHQPSTNRVVARNRRIGVGIVDYTGWRVLASQHRVINYMRRGYDLIRNRSRELNAEAGVPEPIKVTTIKPGGTVPKLAGRTAGIGYPTFVETLRNVRVKKNHPVADILIQANVPYEEEKYDPEHTLVFGFPILQGPAKPAERASLWEQANNLVTVQSEWSDNAVSNTLYFKPKWKLISSNTDKDDFMGELWGIRLPPKVVTEFEDNLHYHYEDDQYKIVVKTNFDGDFANGMIYEFDPSHEEDDLEFVLSAIVPKIKSLSLLPHTPLGVYEQMPEQELSPVEYEKLLANISPIDWSVLTGSDGQDERYCTGEACEVT
jgi:ribonucleoside-triphosphate reductase